MTKRHGASGYTAGCRCDECRKGHREQTNEYRARQRTGHNARSDALALLGLTPDEAASTIAHWTAARLRGAIIILAAAVDVDMPISQFGTAA